MTTTEPRTGKNLDATELLDDGARHRADLLDDPTEVIPAVALPAVDDAPVRLRKSGTVMPGRAVEPVGVRRRTGDRPPGDSTNLGAAALGGLAVAFLLFGVVGPLAGKLGFVVVAWLAFVGIYALLTSLDNSGPMVRDRIMGVVLASIATVLFGSALVVIFFVVGRGWSAMVHLNFYTKDQSITGPLDGLDSGGILHAVLGTLWMMTICLLITIPLGIACAVFIAVVKGPGSRFVRTIVEAMTALPSIVAGLFILATWILVLGFERSGLAASFALSVMMLPIIVRAADVVLRLVPGTLMEASEALGAPRWRTVWHVILPTSKSGLATAIILGTARGIGETSPVLLTAGVTQSFNANPLNGPMVSLPLQAFLFTRSPQPAFVVRGFGTAAVLMILVLILFVIARVLGGRGPGQLSNSQRRRVLRQSAADARRFAARDEPNAPAPSAPSAPPLQTGNL